MQATDRIPSKSEESYYNEQIKFNLAVPSLVSVAFVSSFD